MTSQRDRERRRGPGKPQDDSAPKAAKPSETKRELTDDEIAAVAGGLLPYRLSR